MAARIVPVLALLVVLGALVHTDVRLSRTPPPAMVVQPAYRHGHQPGCSRLVNGSPLCGLSKANLQYFGGPVLANVKIVMVLYGSGTYASFLTNDTAPSMASFYSQVVDSSYLDWLSQFSTPTQAINRGSYVGKVQIMPSLSRDGATITDAQIQAELTAQIQSMALPTPDANTLFMIHFPQGKSISAVGTSSCVAGGFCGYHSTFILNGSDAYYAVLPDQSPGTLCSGGCGASNSQMSNQTSVASHELIESITDPGVGLANVYGPPLGWYDKTNGEVGDICNACETTFAGTDGFTYTVQRGWSNSSAACIATGPNINPPVISNVSVSNVTATGAAIAWTTDVPSNSSVAFGTSGGTVSDGSLVTSHSLSLTGLTPGTLYHFQVSSATANSAPAFSSDQMFTTLIGVLQLSAGSYLASETDGQAAIMVTRTVDTSVTATVNLVTTDGTAISGTDYTGGTFPVTFGPGVANQSVTIAITDDNLIEPPNSFTVSLSGATGAVVGSPGSAQVTIADDTARTAPTNLQAFPVAPTQVRLTWQSHSTNETSFQVERMVSGGAFTVIGSAPAGAFGFLDTSATASTTLTYQVRAVNGNAASNFSATATTTIPAGGKLKISPTKLSFGKVTAAKPKTLTVTLSNSGKGVLAGIIGAPGTPGAPYSVVSGGGPFTIPVHGSPVKVSVKFAPTAPTTASMTLPITSTDPAHASNSVALTGTFKP